ncbi:OLC1v1037889C2 [Oldenlandia corymbosa var. corymbosa]|nr:OLC1v1037889C2 [Oldenlandia corymbosa var. corymbosa]
MGCQLKVALLFWSLIAAIITTQRAASASIRIDFYDQTCPRAEKIIFTEMQKILQRPEFKNAPAQLLRLFFHDCFIGGCDASVLLNTGNLQDEKQAGPNLSLKGFEIINMIKEALERECPVIVSCSDILVIATRDAMILSGGPFYPVYTGRRDSKVSFLQKASLEIPSPMDHIDKILMLFAQRGFTARETVALLGGHSIGFISCAFIQPRINNDTNPDPYIGDDFKEEIRQRCEKRNSNFSMMDPQQLSSASSSSPFTSHFGTHYYESLTRRRGLLFSDMELMANEQTAAVVEEYVSDDGSTFQRDFITALVKMSNLVTLTGSQGEVRLNCSVPLNT